VSPGISRKEPPMSKLLNIITNELVMTAIGALVAATVGALIAFHVHISPVQREAVEGWGIAVLGLGVAVRSAVTPAKAKKQGSK
jgi:hypothetical protein